MQKVKSVFQSVVRILSLVISQIFKFISIVFGSLNYQKPNWLKKTFEFLGIKFSNLSIRYPKLLGYSKKTMAGLIVAGLIGAAGYYTYHYFRPPMQKVTVSVETPAFPSIVEPKVFPVRIVFSEPVAHLRMIGQIDSENFKISPKIEGQWIWKTDREAHFVPEKKVDNPIGWLAGQEYEIRISDRFFPKGLELSEDETKFTYWVLEVGKYGQELYRDPVNPKIQSGAVQFSFRFPINTEDVRRRLSARLKSRSGTETFSQTIALNTKFNEQENIVYVTTENISTPLEDSTLVIELQKGSLGKWGGEAAESVAEIAIPGRSSLRVRSARLENVRNENFEPEQAIVVETSLPIAGRKLLEHLEVVVLPEGPQKKMWTSINELGDEDLNKAEKVQLQLHPTEKVESEYQSLKVKVPSQRQLLVRVRKGLTNAADYIMPLDYEEIVDTGEAPKEIMMMGHGVLLSMSGDKKIPILSRNMSSIKAELFRLLPEQISQITRESLSSNYLNAFFSQSLLWDASQKIVRTLTLPEAKDQNDTRYTSLDLSDVLKNGQKGLFYVRLSEQKKAKPESEDTSEEESEDQEYYSYDQAGQRDQRLILITDLGLISKRDFAGGISIFVQNLRTGGPVAGAKVQVVGRNGLTLLEETTNEEGLAKFPKLSSYRNEKQPTAFVATKGDDYVFMAIENYDRRLDYSKFDVGGVFESTESDSLIAYTFSDRGMYRPGEEVRIGYMVRSRLMTKVDKDIPLEAIVTAPDGTEVERKLIRVNTDDLDDFLWSSSDESPTGTYQFKLQVPRGKKPEQLIGEVSFRVEEFVPDELSVFAHYGVDTSQGWSSDSKADLKITLKNLFGTPAQDRTIETKLSVTPVQPFFRKFSKYRFSFDNKNNLSLQEDLASQETDVKGEALQNVDLSKLSAGFYQVTLDTQAQQAGSGRSVYARSQSYFSNAAYLVGYSSESDLEYLKQVTDPTGESVIKPTVELIAIDSNLNLAETKELEFNLFKTEYVSSLIRQPNGFYKYQSVKKDSLIKAEKISFQKAIRKINLPLEQKGDFYYSLKSGDGLELTRIHFSVIGEGSEQRGLDRSSELKMTLKTKDFEPEAEVEVEIRAPYAGAGLITIEREKILAHRWFKSSTATSVQKIKIPAGVEGHAYLNVLWLRSMDAKQIYTNPLSYAVESFSVSLDRRKNKIELDFPEIIKPGDELKITYSATDKTPIIIYGVNEGILQIAKYVNPNAVDFFFKRKALQVTTFQLLDLLRPDFSILQSLSGGPATGGDMEGGGDSMSLNPFKRKSDPPVVFWSGNIVADATKKTYTYKVPDFFNGSMRILAVAANASKFAVKTGQVTVRGDLILTPSIPFFLAPADEFEGTVVVSNQKRGSGPKAEVNLTLSGELIQILEDAKVKLEIPEGEERSHTVKMKAMDQLGVATFKAEASIGAGADKSTARREISLSVRPAQVFQSTFEFQEVKNEVKLPITRDVYEAYASGELTFSSLPLGFIGTAETFLSNYEYYCTEQLMSRAIGFVALQQLGWDVKGRMSHDKKRLFKLQDELSKIVGQIKSRQLGNGSFSLYPYGSALPSLSHQFLLLDDQLKKSGMNLVPSIMKERVIRDLESRINFSSRVESMIENLEDTSKTQTGGKIQLNSTAALRNMSRDLYWLAKNAKLVTKKAEALSATILKNKDKVKDSIMESYLAATFELLKMKPQAEQHWKRAKLFEKPVWSSRDLTTQTTANSEILYLVGNHNLELQKKWSDPATLKFSFSEILNGHIQSNSAALALVAAQSLLANHAKNVTVSATEVRTGGKSSELKISGAVLKKASFVPQLQTIIAKSSEPMFVGVGVSGFSKKAPISEVENGISVVRDYFTEDPSGEKVTPVTNAVLGEDVWVRIRFKSTDGSFIDQAAIIDLLPAGLEPILSSVPSGQARDVRAQGEIFDDGTGGGEDYVDGESEESSQEAEEGNVGAGLAYEEPNYGLIRSVDRREDRMIIYSSISGSSQEFVYKAKAVAVGKFKIPAPFAENMYDSTVYFMGTEGEFVVLRK